MMKVHDDSRDLILAIDCGTQNVKAAVFDPEGSVITLSRHLHTPNYSPKPRFVEHDPEDYWENTCAAVQEALAALGTENIKRLRSVGLTSQRGTVIPIDKDGHPTRPAIHFMDTRRIEGLSKLGGFWGLFFRVIGLHTAITYLREHSWYSWIKINEPEIYKKTKTFMQVASFLTFRLTGEIAESIGNMVGMTPFDHSKFKFYHQKGIQDIYGVTPEQLPALKPPSSVMGHITREAATKTGIPEGLPVIVGGGDVQSALIGMGAIRENIAAMVLGTVNVLDIPSRKYIKDKEFRFLSWAAAVPGHYIIERGLKGGFATVTWFKEQLAHHESEMAKNLGKTPEEILEEAIRDISPGSLGLFVQPHWNPPFHRDDWARGSIIGFTMAHSRAHIYRAMLEGMVFETREGYEAISEVSGIEVSEIRVSGGGSRSNTFLDITANVFNTPTVRMKVDEASALGAAVCAAFGSGLVSSIEDGIARMVHTAERFEPDSDKRNIYEAIYKTYKKIYPRLSEILRETSNLALYD
jgi:sugar (pentulose or hexulose) kinase